MARGLPSLLVRAHDGSHNKRERFHDHQARDPRFGSGCGSARGDRGDVRRDDASESESESEPEASAESLPALAPRVSAAHSGAPAEGWGRDVHAPLALGIARHAPGEESGRAAAFRRGAGTRPRGPLLD